MNSKTRTLSFIVFSLLAAASIFYTFQIRAEFNFEQFFPDGDPDLVAYYEFIEEFETDDNFLMVAVDRKAGVFDSIFLEKFHDFSKKSKRLPFVKETMSLTKMSYPLKTPFGFATTPVIHLSQPGKYEKNKSRILEDERFAGTLIANDATSILVFLKLDDNVQIDDSRLIMSGMDSLVNTYGFDDYHYLGRPNFQVEFVDLQMREIIMSAVVSALLVTLVMFFIFRRFWGVMVAMISIGLGMIYFTGMLGAAGRPLNIMAALYPVLLIIVGTSDVVHVMSKYIDELKKGATKKAAIGTSIREIGMATLLTSLTTAAGFLTLLTSKIGPIREFGVNSAIGVVIAYITVICFTTALLSLFREDQIIRLSSGKSFWEKPMDWFYRYTRDNSMTVGIGLVVTLAMCGIGISMVSTNYSIAETLPRGKKLTSDYLFFEKNYAGFRPFEIAVTSGDTFSIHDYKVLQEIDKVEQHLNSYDAIGSSQSVTTLYKSMNRAFNGNRLAAYQFPKSESKYRQYKKYLSKMPKSSLDVMVSKNGDKGRISARILDVGSDTIQLIGKRIDDWIAQNTNPEIATFKRTGTGILFDKNEEYVRDSILQGLGLAIAAVSLLMGFLFRNWRMVLISIIPNILPLLIAGALLGFTGIELESGVTIIFAIVFGIAVDDTIHFLSKYKLSRDKGMDLESAMRITFLETGKAICLTSIILFFGFLIMLFSINPPSVRVGLIISVTLASALFSDLFTIPVLIRWFLNDSPKKNPVKQNA